MTSLPRLLPDWQLRAWAAGHDGHGHAVLPDIRLAAQQRLAVLGLASGSTDLMPTSSEPEDDSPWDESDWDDVSQHLSADPWFAAIQAGESPGDPQLDEDDTELSHGIALTPRTAEASTVPQPTVPPGGPGLFHMKGHQLPPYVQHLYKHLVGKYGKHRAYGVAIGIVKKWAAGINPGGKGKGHHVHADVQAAAAKNVGQWEKEKAEAHAHHAAEEAKHSAPSSDLVALGWVRPHDRLEHYKYEHVKGYYETPLRVYEDHGVTPEARADANAQLKLIPPTMAARLRRHGYSVAVHNENIPLGAYRWRTRMAAQRVGPENIAGLHEPRGNVLHITGAHGAPGSDGTAPALHEAMHAYDELSGPVLGGSASEQPDWQRLSYRMDPYSGGEFERGHRGLDAHAERWAALAAQISSGHKLTVAAEGPDGRSLPPDLDHDVRAYFADKGITGAPPPSIPAEPPEDPRLKSMIDAGIKAMQPTELRRQASEGLTPYVQRAAQHELERRGLAATQADRALALAAVPSYRRVEHGHLEQVRAYVDSRRAAVHGFIQPRKDAVHAYTREHAIAAWHKLPLSVQEEAQHFFHAPLAVKMHAALKTAKDLNDFRDALPKWYNYVFKYGSLLTIFSPLPGDEALPYVIVLAGILSRPGHRKLLHALYHGNQLEAGDTEVDKLAQRSRELADHMMMRHPLDIAPLHAVERPEAALAAPAAWPSAKPYKRSFLPPQGPSTLAQGIPTRTGVITAPGAKPAGAAYGQLQQAPAQTVSPSPPLPPGVTLPTSAEITKVFADVPEGADETLATSVKKHLEAAAHKAKVGDNLGALSALRSAQVGTHAAYRAAVRANAPNEAAVFARHGFAGAIPPAEASSATAAMTAGRQTIAAYKQLHVEIATLIDRLRRVYFHGMVNNATVARLSAQLVLANIASGDKLPHALVGYQDTSPDPAKRCANCYMYSLKDGQGSCTIVEPPIRAQGKCERWVPVPVGTAAGTKDEFLQLAAIVKPYYRREHGRLERVSGYQFKNPVDRKLWHVLSGGGKKYRPGQGFFIDTQGEKHWGWHGAAGLLVHHTDEQGVTRYLLQKRGSGVQHGGTWSTPGGAIDTQKGRLESPEEAAFREGSEEFGPEFEKRVEGMKVTSHDVAQYGTPGTVGSWQYHTIHVESPEEFNPEKGAKGKDSWESGGFRWATPKEMEKLPLHPGFLPQANKLGRNPEVPNPEPVSTYSTWSPGPQKPADYAKGAEVTWWNKGQQMEGKVTGPGEDVSTTLPTSYKVTTADGKWSGEVKWADLSPKVVPDTSRASFDTKQGMWSEGNKNPLKPDDFKVGATVTWRHGGTTMEGRIAAKGKMTSLGKGKGALPADYSVVSNDGTWRGPVKWEDLQLKPYTLSTPTAKPAAAKPQLPGPKAAPAGKEFQSVKPATQIEALSTTMPGMHRKVPATVQGSRVISAHEHPAGDQIILGTEDGKYYAWTSKATYQAKQPKPPWTPMQLAGQPKAAAPASTGSAAKYPKAATYGKPANDPFFESQAKAAGLNPNAKNLPPGPVKPRIKDAKLLETRHTQALAKAQQKLAKERETRSSARTRFIPREPRTMSYVSGRVARQRRIQPPAAKRVGRPARG